MIDARLKTLFKNSRLTGSKNNVGQEASSSFGDMPHRAPDATVWPGVLIQCPTAHHDRASLYRKLFKYCLAERMMRPQFL